MGGQTDNAGLCPSIQLYNFCLRNELGTLIISTFIPPTPLPCFPRVPALVACIYLICPGQMMMRTTLAFPPRPVRVSRMVVDAGRSRWAAWTGAGPINCLNHMGNSNERFIVHPSEDLGMDTPVRSNMSSTPYRCLEARQSCGAMRRRRCKLISLVAGGKDRSTEAPKRRPSAPRRVARTDLFYLFLAWNRAETQKCVLHFPSGPRRFVR